MKAVILAGGFGTRISEESYLKPKPMVEIGGKPIIWHIMKIYSFYGINDFIICLGYKGYLIKEYFANYYLHMSDVTIDMSRSGSMEVHHNQADPWRVTLVDTGENTMTGGRLKRVSRYLGDEDFCMTYGDGVADIDINALLVCHQRKKGLATLTATQAPARFGALVLSGDRVCTFEEKPQEGGAWINGGFFVLSPRVLDYITGDDVHWERRPMEALAAEGKLFAYMHHGFWQPMDTVRDKNHLEGLWNSGQAPWKMWR